MQPINREALANDIATTLAAAITSTTATSFTVVSATGFPLEGKFRVRIDNELMLITGINGNTWTAQRGSEGTVAAVHSTGAAVVHVLTADSFRSALSELTPYEQTSTLHYEGSSVISTPTLDSFTTWRNLIRIVNSNQQVVYVAQKIDYVGTTGRIDRIAFRLARDPLIDPATSTSSVCLQVSLQSPSAGSGLPGQLAGNSNVAVVRNVFANIASSVVYGVPHNLRDAPGRVVSVPFNASGLSAGQYWVVFALTFDYLGSSYTQTQWGYYNTPDLYSYFLGSFSSATPDTAYGYNVVTGLWESHGSWRTCLDVYSGDSGKLKNVVINGAGNHWNEYLYDADGKLSYLMETDMYYGKTKTLTYRNGILAGVS